MPVRVGTLRVQYKSLVHRMAGSRRFLSAWCPSHDVTVTTVTTVGREVQLSAPHAYPTSPCYRVASPFHSTDAQIVVADCLNLVSRFPPPPPFFLANAGLGALYGPLILYIPAASVHRAFVNAFKSTNTLNSVRPGQ